MRSSNRIFNYEEAKHRISHVNESLSANEVPFAFAQDPRDLPNRHHNILDIACNASSYGDQEPLQYDDAASIERLKMKLKFSDRFSEKLSDTKQGEENWPEKPNFLGRFRDHFFDKQSSSDNPELLPYSNKLSEGSLLAGGHLAGSKPFYDRALDILGTSMEQEERDEDNKENKCS